MSGKHNNSGTRFCNRMTESKRCDFVGCTFCHSAHLIRFIECRDKNNCKKFKNEKNDCEYYHPSESSVEYMERHFHITPQTHEWMYRHPHMNYEYCPSPSSEEEAEYLLYCINQETQKQLKLTDSEIEDEMEEVLNEIQRIEEDILTADRLEEDQLLAEVTSLYEENGYVVY